MAVHIKSKLLTIARLNLFHVLVVTERQVINCVRKVQGPSIHVELLNDWPESMSREMEVSWHFINNSSAFNNTALAIIHGLDSISVYFFGALTSIRKMSGILHHVMDADVPPISIDSMFMQTTSDVDDMHSCDIDHIQAQDVTWCLMHGDIHVYVKLI
jgi:hypothetical protein